MFLVIVVVMMLLREGGRDGKEGVNGLRVKRSIHLLLLDRA